MVGDSFVQVVCELLHGRLMCSRLDELKQDYGGLEAGVLNDEVVRWVELQEKVKDLLRLLWVIHSR
jgi:hypothetical protein